MNITPNRRGPGWGRVKRKKKGQGETLALLEVRFEE